MSDTMTGAVASAPASTGGSQASSPEPASTPAPDAGQSASSSTLFEALEDDTAPPESVTEEPAAEPQVPTSEQKAEQAFYKGKYKSLEDYDKSHEELERAYYRAAQERAEFAKYAQQLQAQQQQQPPQAPEPRFFHEFDNKRKEDTWNDFHANFEKDPESMIFNMGVNIPHYVENAVKQALQNQDIINPLQQNILQNTLQTHQQLQQQEAMYAGHIKDFAEKNPLFKQYEEPVYNVLSYLKQTGMLDQARKAGIDPIDMAYRYVLGNVTEEQKANVVAVAQENARQEAAQASRGFQITTPSQARTVAQAAPKADPLGIFKNEKPKALFEY
jgi:hypothetical protein